MEVDVAKTRASEEWARHLERHIRGTRWTRRVMRRLPHEPRCKFCFAPFAGAGAPVARAARTPAFAQEPEHLRRLHREGAAGRIRDRRRRPLFGAV